MKKAQTSLEYAVIVAMVLLATIPLFYIARERYTGDVVMVNAESAVDRLIDAADEVYATGPGTIKYVWITLPGGISSTDVSGRHVSITYNTKNGPTDVHGLARANLSGSIPTASGGYRVKIEAVDNGVIITP